MHAGNYAKIFLIFCLTFISLFSFIVYFIIFKISNIHRFLTYMLTSVSNSAPQSFNLCMSKAATRGALWNKLRPAILFKKETLAQVFSCEFCEISRNTFITESLWTIASSILLKRIVLLLIMKDKEF